MEITPKKCHVVMKKIMLGERAMHRCIVPIKRLTLSDGHASEKRCRGERTLSQFELQKFRVLLRKMKLSHDGPVGGADVAENKLYTVACPPLYMPTMKRRRFRVLLRRLKLKTEIQERLDHTIFIHNELGFVTNPYLIPGYQRNRLNTSRIKLLKMGRRSRASRCRVHIKKLQVQYPAC